MEFWRKDDFWQDVLIEAWVWQKDQKRFEIDARMNTDRGRDGSTWTSPDWCTAYSLWKISLCTRPKALFNPFSRLWLTLALTDWLEERYHRSSPYLGPMLLCWPLEISCLRSSMKRYRKCKLTPRSFKIFPNSIRWDFLDVVFLELPDPHLQFYKNQPHQW